MGRKVEGLTASLGRMYVRHAQHKGLSSGTWKLARCPCCYHPLTLESCSPASAVTKGGLTRSANHGAPSDPATLQKLYQALRGQVEAAQKLEGVVERLSRDLRILGEHKEGRGM